MKIASLQYSPKHKAYEIYISGCKGDCNNCSNPEIKNFNVGIPIEKKLDEIVNYIDEFNCLIDNIWLLGGEPCDQNITKLNILINALTGFDKSIWLWTRYCMCNLPMQLDLDNIDFIKVGSYFEDLPSKYIESVNITLASSNQNIYKKGIRQTWMLQI